MLDWHICLQLVQLVQLAATSRAEDILAYAIVTQRSTIRKAHEVLQGMVDEGTKR